MDIVPPRCRQLASPNAVNFAFSLLIVLGILISYLPQHARIIYRRSSFGISPYFVLLGTTSSTSALANILTLQRSSEDMSCCKHISGVACFAGMLGILQVGTQCFCFFVILLLYIMFYPRATSPRSPAQHAAAESSSEEAQAQPPYGTALAVTALCILHALVVTIVSVALAVRRSDLLQGWAVSLGVLAAILALIQYFPQIYTTLRLRCVGSLSIPMMCIQTPGSLVWAGSLAARMGADGWSSWGVLVVTACLQGTLLAMAVYFEYLSPRKSQVRHYDSAPAAAARAESEITEDGSLLPSEETPLLQS